MVSFQTGEQTKKVFGWFVTTKPPLGVQLVTRASG